MSKQLAIRCTACGDTPAEGQWCKCDSVRSDGGSVKVSGRKWSEAWEPVDQAETQSAPTNG